MKKYGRILDQYDSTRWMIPSWEWIWLRGILCTLCTVVITKFCMGKLYGAHLMADLRANRLVKFTFQDVLGGEMSIYIAMPILNWLFLCKQPNYLHPQSFSLVFQNYGHSLLQYFCQTFQDVYLTIEDIWTIPTLNKWITKKEIN